MKFNQLPNLRVEDFAPEQSWLSGLFIQLNPFIQAVNQVINGNLSYPDNVYSVSNDYSVTVTTFQSFSFLWGQPATPPKDVRVMIATKSSAQTPCILLCAWSYNASTKSVTIPSMYEVSSSGVAALSGAYKFTVRATV